MSLIPSLLRAMLAATCLAGASCVSAASFTVVTDGSASDNNLGDGVCAISGGGCTLQAAIQQANATAGFDTINFGRAKVTLTASIQNVTERVLFNGTFGGARAEIDGASTNSCFNLSSPGGSVSANPLVPQANNSRIEHLVIHNCLGNGISLNGHGYVVLDSYIGLLPNGSTVGANSGDGISISANLADGAIPSLPAIPLPGQLADLPAILAFVAGALPSLAPTGIVNNVISGNTNDGIEIFGQYAATTIIFDNVIGLSANSLLQRPNGTGGGGGSGINLTSSTYCNFIGIDNTIAGNNSSILSDGILVNTGKVPFPNFIAGNFVGVSKLNFISDFGNGQSGIHIADARITTGSDPVPNPLQLAVVVGPGNVVGYNRGTTASLLDENNNNGGIVVGGDHARVWGNLVGISTPDGSAVNIGNAGDGIIVTGTDHEIGGASIVEGNIVARNLRHGIVVRGSASTFRNKVRGNSIGTLPPPLETADQGNVGIGLWLLSGSNLIGGNGAADLNRISHNGGHAIQVKNSGAWANLIRKNEISAVPVGKLGIDLDAVANGPDPIDDSQGGDRSGTQVSYSNWQQNTLAIGTAGYDAGTGASSAAWNLQSGPNGQYRIEFYVADGNRAVGKTFLGEMMTTTNAAGLASGTAPLSPATPMDTRGMYFTATVTDLKPTFGAEPNPPGLLVPGPANNTSEFAAPVRVPIPGQLRIQPGNLAQTVPESAGTATINVERINGSEGAVSVAYTTVPGTAVAPDDYATSAGVLQWADGDTAPKPISVSIVNDAVTEPPETFTIALSSPTGQVELLVPLSASVTIDASTPVSLQHFDVE
ncbi:MAG: Calx-beta domain-containing protein [Tahibacter sp.]